MHGYSDIEREKENLINATSLSLEQSEKSKNETLYFEKQRAMNHNGFSNKPYKEL
jgi:F-type H+-transporting ATPase subunit b